MAGASSSQIYHAQAPIRIDLAGGTLDLSPVYLILKDQLQKAPATLNLGVDLYANTVIQIAPTQSSDPRCTLQSMDLEVQEDCRQSELAQIDDPKLVLHAKFLKLFLDQIADPELKQYSIHLTTHALGPAGAGMGGSSALSVSILSALLAWRADVENGWEGSWSPDETEGRDLIEWVRDVEMQVLGVPAGMQDYFAATFGGLQEIRWGERWHHSRQLKSDLLQKLQDRLLLFYSGHSRNSGINNWQVYQDFINEDPSTTQCMHQIAKHTDELTLSLEKEDWGAATQAVLKEWSARKRLAPDISTPEIDQFLEVVVSQENAAGKICGAGGGGCFYILFKDPIQSLTTSWSDSPLIKKFGFKHLPFDAVPGGVQVRRSSPHA